MWWFDKNKDPELIWKYQDAEEISKRVSIQKDPEEGVFQIWSDRMMIGRFWIEEDGTTITVQNKVGTVKAWW